MQTELNIYSDQNSLYNIYMKNDGSNNCKGNPEPSLSSHRIVVKCATCGKAKSINMFEFNKNKTGNFYCDWECLSVGHRINYSGPNNSFFGKKHKAESLAKISENWGDVRRPLTTITGVCKHCGGEYEVPKSHAPNGSRIYCSLKCRRTHDKSSRKQMKCFICGKEVIRRAGYDLGRTFCSSSCNGKYQGSIQPKGEGAYWFGKEGEGTPNWRGGLSSEPYSAEFNIVLKRKIRDRDDHRCQLCGLEENGKKLHIHHVDYNKKNNSSDNLISLCKVCHCKTNGNRSYYTNYFKTLLNGQEGATTIPQGSTPQANGGGSAEHPIPKGDDIVCSSRKLEAAS